MFSNPRSRVLATLAGLFLSTAALAGTGIYQTCSPYTSCGSVPIPDFPGAPADVFLSVPSDSVGNYIQDITVSFWVQHTYQGDLRIELTSPAGTSVTLINRPGGGGFAADNFGGVQCFSPPPTCNMYPMTISDSAPAVYDTPAVPFPGYDDGGLTFAQRYYKPVQSLSTLRGESKVGTWRLRVTDLAGADVGSIRYFALSIDARQIGDPVAVIDPLGYCLCGSVPIIGTANDPSGPISFYQLEWALDFPGPWTVFATGTQPVVNGLLGTFNPLSVGIPDPGVILRLTVFNELNLASVAYESLGSDVGFGVLQIRSPGANGIVGGTVCTDGHINDNCFDYYRIEVAGPPFNTYSNVGSVSQYTPAVINDPLGSWNTLGGSFPDGPYRLRFTGISTCGMLRSQSVDVTVDNTAPVAIISTPNSCTKMGASVEIRGTVSDTNLSGWTLQYTGGASHGWVTIASGSSAVNDNVLATWNTSSLVSPCSYTIRLIASDLANVNCGHSNSTEYTVSVDLGCNADFDGDGDTGTDADIEAFFRVLGGGPCI